MKAKNLIELFGTEVIVNVLITALEGGSNYWYDIADLSMIKRVKGKSMSESIVIRVIEDDTIKVPIVDVEDEEEFLGYFTKESIENGVELFLKDGRAFVDDMDASEADVFFQFAVLGEIVYG